ncbi:MAG: hypothetical protein K2Q24_15895 [Chitinophagaceae bacterium]|jgi:hypothetical protein|nr:hypothetical protein [Chitinophagaceae bacterium]
MKKKTYYISLLALRCFLFFYVLKRAALLSLTHDESATTDLVAVPLNEIMFSPNQFQTANNHILHSILMKWSVLFFGWKEWSIRLPGFTRADATADQLADIDYYYITGEEIKNIHPVYKPVKRFFWDRFLLKKDEAAYQAAIAAYINQNKKNLPDTTDDALYKIADEAFIKQRKEINWAALFFSN